MRKVLQDVKFTDQARFKQFVLQSKSRMEVHHCISSCERPGSSYFPAFICDGHLFRGIVFNSPYGEQIINTLWACMQSRISGGGHGVAAARMDAKLNTAGWVSEQMGGLRYISFVPL